MEKLLQLLNEFKEGKPFQFIGYDEKYWMFDTNLNAEGSTSLPEETITSKKFWFIEWLVIYGKVKYWPIEELTIIDKDWRMYWYTDTLLMLLAIQDDPIEFLISVLK